MSDREIGVTTALERIRLGIDVGGTFTDAALEADGRLWTAKVLTTHAAPDDGVIQVMDRVLSQAGISADRLDLVIHGTTLATNALIERKGAKTAMLTTAGVRDVVQIGFEQRFDLYDLHIEMPVPLVPRSFRFPVRERMSATGRELMPLNMEDVEDAAAKIEQAQIDAVAVCFLHSYIEPQHEELVGEYLSKKLPRLFISLSSEVAPEMREFERFSTACANAYVQPKMASYLQRLESRLHNRGVRSPLLLMLSGGGLTTIDTAIKFPVRLVESGPAGGAVFASELALQNGLNDIVSFDMGGTTAKICLIDDGQPQTSRLFEVARVYRFKKGSGMPLRIPVIEMVEIGAGGGSIARLDNLQRVNVGPESAGSEPGPVCYARGGAAPTVTDADLVLGRISPAGFDGGKFPLENAAASAAVEQTIGKGLGLNAAESAAAIVNVVDENMAAATRIHAAESGKTLNHRTLVAFGGAAPLHVAAIARKLGVRSFLIPTAAGVGSAVGFLWAPVSYEIARTKPELLAAADLEEVSAFLDRMAEAAIAIVCPAARTPDLVEARAVTMRYRGQGYEITVPVPAKGLSEADRGPMLEMFEERYRQVYGRTVPGAEPEFMTWSVRISEPPPARRSVASKAPEYIPTDMGTREIFDPTQFQMQTCQLYDRSELKPGAIVQGPAIIEEQETSTLIPPNMRASVLSTGAILCEELAPSSELEKKEDLIDA
ncbi:hydantoinase/oxoprolinase family protein [Rhodoligotrophos defluvii]|uniref:hydantoinase/oxoprolinase family protein n=1 Tax=Rhodoligotrophos defluvii TaxID=2561934 RepID=UPI0010CA03F3|nr:hydantoinase/oxoprolinase family protein [Rhodoligotrophos defluvii]